MNWKEIRLVKETVYPANSITVFMMDTESGVPATHWVDKAYTNYAFKEECMYNCYVTVDLTDAFNAQQEGLDAATIEDYFTANLREVCVCHLVARITTDNGMSLELYVDDVDSAIKKFNELEDNKDRLLNFSCEITDDEAWANVAEILN